MALPYEGDTEVGRNAEYDLASGSSEVQPLNVIPRTSKSNIEQEGHDEIEDDDDHEPPKSLYHRICPGCITRIPSIILITLMIVLVLFVVCSIPLVFALTYSDSSAQIAQQGNTSELPTPDEAWPAFPDVLLNDSMVSENASSSIFLAHLLPKNVSLCEGRGFACVNFPSITIGLNSVCDGIADCPDGSDEAGCKECKTSFSCSSSSLASSSNSSSNSSESFFNCLRAGALCDGNVHCSDQSDEVLCTKSCSSSEFQCPDSKMCLPQSFRCDGEIHCPGSEDEQNCNGECSNGSKWCESSKSCLPKWMLCNGKAECEDASDEQGCSCNECAGRGKMLCKSSTSDTEGLCLESSRVCDGVADCPDGQDEDGCPGELKAPSVEMVKCKDGKEYSKVYACLGLIPSCKGSCEKCDEKFAFNCGNNDCILKSRRCDGKQDCENGADEQNCECSSTSYQCKSPLKDGKIKCIEESQRCDGFIDCPGGDDEEKCSKCSTEEIFKCKNQEKCISPTERCDGRKHCSDGSDEEDCSAEECAIHPFPMYLCKDGKSCFRNDEVCRPYSACPAPASEDKGFCPGIRFRFRI